MMKRLQNQPGVIGSILMKTNGLTIRATTFSDSEVVHYAGLIGEFVMRTKSSLEQHVFGGDPIDEIRLRTHKNEIIITPDKDYILAVVQDANAQA